MAVDDTEAKRKHPRFPTDIVCLYRVEGTFHWETGELLNLSKGGFCIKAKVPPAKDAIVEIEIDLNMEDGGRKKRKMKARVMWKRGKRAGLNFT